MSAPDARQGVRSIHQQLALCFHAVPTKLDGATVPSPDGTETNAAAWCNLAAIADLVMHPAMRQRLQDAITELHQVRIA
jgi:hypothetical protein